MSSFPNDPFLVYKRKGDRTDPFLPYSEPKQVYGGKVVLTEIPDKGNHVTVKDSNNISYAEVYSQASLSANNVYYVDYDRGIVYFDASKEGLTFTFSYLGIGGSYIPATRVYTQSSNGTVTQDVQDMIDNYNQLNGTDLYNLFDPQTGHKHTGGAGDAPAIDSQYVTYNNGQGTVSKVKDTLDSHAAQLADITINIKQKYGVKADGTDETALIQQAINETASVGKKLYFPNGNYGISATLTHTTDITSTLANDPILWEGESSNGVRFVGVNGFTGTAIDLTKSKNVHVKNFISSLYIQLLTFGGTAEDQYNSQRQVYAESVFCDGATGKPINWGLLLTTPKPSSYSGTDGTYARYPLEIHNYGGYNGIMVVNRSVDANGNIVNGAFDNSAIGITDAVKGVSSPTFLIQGGYRSFEQFQNSMATYMSGVRSHVVYEVNELGHVAIGCSTVDDPNASGTATMKVRDTYPAIKLFDANRNNHYAKMSLADDFMHVSTNNDADGKEHGFQINYKTGEIQLINGTLTSPNTSITTASTTVNAGGLTRFTLGVAMNIEAFTNGLSGQVIYCIATVSGVVIKNRVFNNNDYIYTNTGADVTLQTGRLYTFVKFDGGWYMQ